MDFVKISNLVNVIAVVHPDVSFYHFGWPSDIDGQIKNNHDPEGSTGITYPMVHWVAPPEGVMDLESHKGVIEKMTLRFFAPQDRDNAGQTKSDTLLEQWEALRRIAVSFLKGLNALRVNGKRVFNINRNRIRITADVVSVTDDLIMVETVFDLNVLYDCYDFEVKTGLLQPTYPWPLESWDYEDLINQPEE